MPNIKLFLDVEMKDADSISAVPQNSGMTYSASTGGDIRSPRTPTYNPTSPASRAAAAFDFSRLFRHSDSKLGKATRRPSTEPTPTRPLAWIWQCHLCKSRYPLAATRRCLQDGHSYCSGEGDQPNLRKRKGQSCSSEFDYVGWEEWGLWKRKMLGSLENGSRAYLPARGCERCDFPSQCRHKQASRSFSRTSSLTTNEKPSTQSKGASAGSSSSTVSGSVTFDSIFTYEDDIETKSSSIDEDAIDASQETSPIMSIDETVKKPSLSSADRLTKTLKGKGSKKSSLSPILEEHLPKVKGISESKAMMEMPKRRMDLD